MALKQQPDEGFLPVIDAEIVAVKPEPGGFVLQAEGRDGAEYRFDIHLDVPMDRQTQVVLGEMLAQSECRVWRRARPSLKAPRSTDRKAKTGGKTMS